MEANTPNGSKEEGEELLAGCDEAPCKTQHFASTLAMPLHAAYDLELAPNINQTL